MAVRYRLQDFAQLNGRGIFVDANVWMYLFWPTGQHSFERNYARVFKNLLKQGNHLFINIWVISEIVNRILRIEHQKISPDQKFKDFKNSPDGNKALNDIHIIIKNDILSHFAIVGKSFDKQGIENILVVDKLDFVDKVIVALCEENSLALLTNDGDFKNTGLDILTGNSLYFN